MDSDEIARTRTLSLLYNTIILKCLYFLNLNWYNALLKAGFAAVDGDSALRGITAGGDAETAVAARGFPMWKHQAGRIDFDEPLFQLFERGWRFQEFAPTVGARDGGCWAVAGFHRGARVLVDRLERRDAWAEAVRLALTAEISAGPSWLLKRPAPGGARRTLQRSLTRSACGSRRWDGRSPSTRRTSRAAGSDGW